MKPRWIKVEAHVLHDKHGFTRAVVVPGRDGTDREWFANESSGLSGTLKLAKARCEALVSQQEDRDAK